MGDAVSAATKFVGFLPWLQLKQAVSVGGFDFVPFRNKSGTIPSALTGLEATFPTILSSYCDTDRPQKNCTIVVDQSAENPDEPWNLSETKREAVQWASSLLFLASWAANEYFVPVGSYVNDSDFQLFFQRFSEPVDYISLSYRRRDGGVLYGGPRHGEIRLVMPMQCSNSPVQIEIDFLNSLESAHKAGSPSVERLKAALPLVRLANTDNDVMTLDAEAALMVFALEQYLEAHKARDLAVKFDGLFNAYGKLTARTAQAQRPGIYPEPRYKEAQLDWLVSKMWLNEFHQYRSSVAHGKSSDRSWGWTPLEHLVMAAFVFPLVVKLCLAHEGHYSLSREDEGRCRAVDVLLGETDWAEDNGSSMQSKWQKIVREKKHDVSLDAIIRNAMAELKAKGIEFPFESEA